MMLWRPSESKEIARPPESIFKRILGRFNYEFDLLIC